MICKEVYLVIISIIVYMDIIDTESRIYFTVHRGTQTDASFFDWEKPDFVVLPFQEYKNMARYYYGQKNDISAGKLPRNCKEGFIEL